MESGFSTAPIADMLAIGAVTTDSARIWIRSENPGPVHIRYWPVSERAAIEQVVVVPDLSNATDRTGCVPIPGTGGAALRQLCRYRVEAVNSSTGRLIGSGEFETSPGDAQSAPDRFSIAWMSCNQPFTEDGLEADHGTQMLAAAAACMERHSTKLVLTLGDQMYTDYPKNLSLFDPKYFERIRPDRGLKCVQDASQEQVRTLLQQRYRHFWNFDGWKRMHARFPCYPAIDDHEIVDNWGCNPEHATERWGRYAEGARAAYADYQGSRVLPQNQHPDSFDYAVEYGPVAAYIFDLRSHRRTGESEERILSKSQFDRFAQFLETHTAQDALVIGLSVPIVHLPRWAAKLGHKLTLRRNEDFADRWSTAGHIRDRDRILSLVRAHQRTNPSQQVYFVSGDIHIACAHRISWADGTPDLIQLVSSGITHSANRVTQTASKLSILANRKIHIDDDGPTTGLVRLIAGQSPSAANPYTDLNVGLLEFQRTASGRYRTRSMIYGHRAGVPHCAFQSPWQGGT